MTLLLAIGSRFTANVRDLEHASQLYGEQRDESGEGGSTFPEGRIMQGGRKIARVSYNGRVWPNEPHRTGLKPLYDPRGFFGDPQDLPRTNGVPHFPSFTADQQRLAVAEGEAVRDAGGGPVEVAEAVRDAFEAMRG